MNNIEKILDALNWSYTKDTSMTGGRGNRNSVTVIYGYNFDTPQGNHRRYQIAETLVGDRVLKKMYSVNGEMIEGGNLIAILRADMEYN